MRYSNIPDFCKWARTYSNKARGARLAGTMFGGSLYITGSQYGNELELGNFIAMPRGIGIVTEALNRIEFLLPELHICVSYINNERFGLFLVKRGYVSTGKREVTLPAKVAINNRRSA